MNNLRFFIRKDHTQKKKKQKKTKQNKQTKTQATIGNESSFKENEDYRSVYST